MALKKIKIGDIVRKINSGYERYIVKNIIEEGRWSKYILDEINGERVNVENFRHHLMKDERNKIIRMMEEMQNEI